MSCKLFSSINSWKRRSTEKIPEERAVHRLGDCSGAFCLEGSLGEAFLKIAVGNDGSFR